MGLNKGKGGKGHKKHKNKDSTEIFRQLIFKEDGQVYGSITKALGNGRFSVKCFGDEGEEDKVINCTIRGNMRKREWIAVGDIVLVSLRDFQPDKADIILKYLPYEVRKLKECNEIDKSVNTSSFNGSFNDDEDDKNIQFGFDSSDDEEINIDEI